MMWLLGLFCTLGRSVDDINKAFLIVSPYPISLHVCLSDDEDDLSTVTPLLVASYMLCYTPFVVSEVTHMH